MNKIKYFILSLALLFIIPLAAGCGADDIVIQQLSTPTNVVVNNGTVSWNVCNHADFYEIHVNGQTFKSTNSHLFIDMLSQNGKYEITVVARSKSRLFSDSEATEVVVIDTRTVLQTPRDFAYDKDNSRFVWRKVENVDNYVISANGSTVAINSDMYTMANGFVRLRLSALENYIFDGKVNTFTLRCAETSKYKASAETQPVYYVNTARQTAPQNLKVTRTGERVFLSFEVVSTATSGYTYYIDDAEQGVSFETSPVDITEKLTELGAYKISVKANSVYSNNNEQLYFESALTELQFDNVPYFANKNIENISVNRHKLSFDKCLDAREYEISIKNITQNKDVASFTVLQTEFENNNCQIDILPYTADFGNYKVSVQAIGYGRANAQYLSNKTDNSSLVVSAILETPTIEIDENETQILVNIACSKYVQSVWIYLSEYILPIGIVENQFGETELSCAISKLILKPGYNKFYAIAIGDGNIFLDSGYTDYATYKVPEVNVPTSLAISNGLLSFVYQGDYDKFTVYVDGESVAEIINMTYQLELTDAGRYQISVRASCGSYVGNISTPISYKITQKLDLPENVVVEDNILTFDSVENATSYDIYLTNANRSDYLIVKGATENSIELPTRLLLIGNNGIKIIVRGDNDIYFDSNMSELYQFKVYGQLDKVDPIEMIFEDEKYILNFGFVEKASGYSVKITSPSNTESIIESLLTTVDIDEYLVETGDYQIEVTAISAHDDYKDSIETAEFDFPVLYNKHYYEANKYYHDGHTHNLMFSRMDLLGDLVIYSVLHGEQEIQIYFDNSDNVYDLEKHTFKEYLPCMTNFNVSMEGKLYQTLGSIFMIGSDLEIYDFLTVFERLHNQSVLYFDIDEVFQTNPEINPNVYTMKFSYPEDFTLEATNHFDYELAKLYRVTEREDFAIDQVEETMLVETVEQLITAVQAGRKPEFVSEDSVAYMTYTYAKNILSKICTSEMTEYQKVLEIYNWLIRNVTNAQESFIEQFSIENLDNMAYYASGALLYRFATSKGYAQAFSLLTGIEGIESIETIAITGGDLDYTNVRFVYENLQTTRLYILLNEESFEDIGIHSYNRVKLDLGEGYAWYVVDVSYDDPNDVDMPMALKHKYFLKNDDFIKTERKEIYPMGDLYYPFDEIGTKLDYSATDNEFDYFKSINCYAKNEIELANLVARLQISNILEVKYEKRLTEQALTVAFTSAGIEMSEFHILIYDNSMAYIYKDIEPEPEPDDPDDPIDPDEPFVPDVDGQTKTTYILIREGIETPIDFYDEYCNISEYWYKYHIEDEELKILAIEYEEMFEMLFVYDDEEMTLIDFKAESIGTEPTIYTGTVLEKYTEFRVYNEKYADVYQMSDEDELEYQSTIKCEITSEGDEQYFIFSGMKYKIEEDNSLTEYIDGEILYEYYANDGTKDMKAEFRVENGEKLMYYYQVSGDDLTLLGTLVWEYGETEDIIYCYMGAMPAPILSFTLENGEITGMQQLI